MRHFEESVVEQASAGVLALPPWIGKQNVDGIDGIGTAEHGNGEFCVGVDDVPVGEVFAFEFSLRDAA